MATNFEMKQKGSDGTFTTLHPKTNTNVVNTETEIKVMMTNPVGSYKNNEVIPAGTSVDTIIKKILQEQIPPSYTAPSISFKVSSGDAAAKYEAGTKLNATLTSTFTSGDAGAITSHKIYNGTTEVVTGTDNPASYTITDLQLGDSNIVFKSTCEYGDGVVKNDNFGDPYDATSIKAGSKTSSNLTYTTYRKYFYIDDKGTAAPTTSDEIRGFTGSSAAATNGTTFNISVDAGQTRVVFAYPATLRDVTSVGYVEMNNDESKGFFNKTTVDVEGAEGFDAISYKVYTYIPDQAFPSAMTFKVTI